MADCGDALCPKHLSSSRVSATGPSESSGASRPRGGCGPGILFTGSGLPCHGGVSRAGFRCVPGQPGFFHGFHGFHGRAFLRMGMIAVPSCARMALGSRGCRRRHPQSRSRCLRRPGSGSAALTGRAGRGCLLPGGGRTPPRDRARWRVHGRIHLAPAPGRISGPSDGAQVPALNAMHACLPPVIAQELDARAVRQQVRRPAGAATRDLHRRSLPAAARGRAVRTGPVRLREMRQAGDHPGRLAERRHEQHLDRQTEPACRTRELPAAAPSVQARRATADDRGGLDARVRGHLLVQPDEERPALSQRSLAWDRFVLRWRAGGRGLAHAAPVQPHGFAIPSRRRFCAGAVIDARLHIRRRAELPSLTGPMEPRILGPYEAQRRDHPMAQDLADIAGQGVVKAVLVEANRALSRGAEEPLWIEEVALATGRPMPTGAFADMHDGGGGAPRAPCRASCRSRGASGGRARRDLSRRRMLHRPAVDREEPMALEIRRLDHGDIKRKSSSLVLGRDCGRTRRVHVAGFPILGGQDPVVVDRGFRDTAIMETLGMRGLNSPDDICVTSDSSICFSDPCCGRMPVHGVERPRQLGFLGGYRLPRGTGREPSRSLWWTVTPSPGRTASASAPASAGSTSTTPGRRRSASMT